jgi:ArsR family transcriptional regulator
MNSRKRQIVYESQAEVLKALAHPVRVAIIDYLKDGRQCVCDIADRIGSQRSNVSKHLSLMVNAGVLQCSKEGLKVMYQLKTPCVINCLDCITKCLKQKAKENQKLLKSL